MCGILDWVQKPINPTAGSWRCTLGGVSYSEINVPTDRSRLRKVSKYGSFLNLPTCSCSRLADSLDPTLSFAFSRLIETGVLLRFGQSQSDSTRWSA